VTVVARFDVYPNPVAAERKHTPFFLDLQNDYIDGLPSRVVAPLRKAAAFGPRAKNLNPVFTIAEEDLVLDMAALGAVPSGLLRKAVANLRGARAPVQEALDTLFGSY
jgi:toxin CcdB